MNLARRIELYLRRTKMSATQFGLESMNDPCLVSDLRNGRELRQRTAARLIAWLDAQEAGQ